MSTDPSIRAGHTYRNRLGSELIPVDVLPLSGSGLYLANGIPVAINGVIWLMRNPASGSPSLWTREAFQQSGYRDIGEPLPGLEPAEGLTHHLVTVYAGSAGTPECAYCHERGVSTSETCMAAPS